MLIYEIKENKKDYIDLLLIADESENIINKWSPLETIKIK